MKEKTEILIIAFLYSIVGQLWLLIGALMFDSWLRLVYWIVIIIHFWVVAKRLLIPYVEKTYG